ncbi:hypothetical protein [Ornithinimicrobium panacihumi]|uniref:hypothetical protein n=1 Tax=Ornithinimicrobium panacihumi TaxID=2008449 RepID=UPI003F8B0357
MSEIDRGSDPSPFAWIFGGALALIGLGSILRAQRNRREQAIIAEERRSSATADEVAEGHPS